MINGSHSVIFSRDPEADRAFFKDVLQLPHVDVGGSWLVFGLPPSEVAVHPADEDTHQELYLLCEDIHALVAALAQHDVSCEELTEQPWGALTHIILPGGGRLGVYEPRHERPANP